MLIKIPRALLVLAALYFLASFGHFSHNAEFICEYPNLPASLTRAKVYAVWTGITLVGAAGLLSMIKGRTNAGLLLVAAYAAMGFDGLGHYALAPMAFHPLAANVTILSEVEAAAVLLGASLHLLRVHVLSTRNVAAIPFRH